jgi:hypothetical protein
VNRSDRHDAGIDAGSLERSEEMLTACLELLLGVPNLEHVNLCVEMWTATATARNYSPSANERIIPIR